MPFHGKVKPLFHFEGLIEDGETVPEEIRAQLKPSETLLNITIINRNITMLAELNCYEIR